jgi:hypothetical protein
VGNSSQEEILAVLVRPAHRGMENCLVEAYPAFHLLVGKEAFPVEEMAYLLVGMAYLLVGKAYLLAKEAYSVVVALLMAAYQAYQMGAACLVQLVRLGKGMVVETQDRPLVLGAWGSRLLDRQRRMNL